MERSLRRYVVALVLVTAIGAACAAAVNYVVDPYGMYGAPLRPGLNAVKPEVSTHMRMSKARIVARLKPRGVILGSSRAYVGLDPSRAGWAPGAEPCYNLALVGGSMYEVRRYFEHAHAARPLRQVVLMLDLFMFNAFKPDKPDFDESRLLVDTNGKRRRASMLDLPATLLSIDALKASVRTVRLQGTDAEATLPDGASCDADIEVSVRRQGGVRNAFRNTEREFMQIGGPGGWFPRPEDRFAFTNETGRNAFSDFGRIVDICRKDGVDLRIGFNPCHARMLEAKDVAGLWPEFEEMKRELVRILARDAAAHPGSTPFPLWDFTGYNSVTSESVPPPDDRDATMKGYWEASHFKKSVGVWVLDRMLGVAQRAPAIPEDFGVRLDESNIESHLARIREERESWRAAHTGDAAEVRSHRRRRSER